MSTYQDPWNADYAKLFGDPGNPKSGDIYIAQQEQVGLSDSVQAYAAAMMKVKNTDNPMVAFTMLAWLMANQGFQQLNYQSAVDGGALKVQGDLTTLNNDLEDMTNQTGDATATADSRGHDGYSYTYNFTKENSYLYLVATRSEDLYQKLDVKGTGWDKSLTDIMGSEASNSLSENYLTIRQQIYASGLANNGTSYYFNADEREKYPPWDSNTNGQGHIDSYCQFQIDLETRGDPYNANEAMKAKTDAFNENTSTTQSTNAASQEMISNDNNKAKAVQAFVVAMFHAITDVISACVKSVAKG